MSLYICLVFNISQKKKKLKDLFVYRPPVHPSTRQPVTTRAGALVVRVEHWTPKGDCTERGDKERYDQRKFSKKVMRFKKRTYKIIN